MLRFTSRCCLFNTCYFLQPSHKWHHLRPSFYLESLVVSASGWPCIGGVAEAVAAVGATAMPVRAAKDAACTLDLAVAEPSRPFLIQAGSLGSNPWRACREHPYLEGEMVTKSSSLSP